MAIQKMVLRMASDGSAGNYAIRLFGTQVSGIDAVTKHWKIWRDISRRRGDNTQRQIHQGGANFKLSQQK